MLNSRQKQGATGINWADLSLCKKYQRKTIGFGAYDKKHKRHESTVYIRELCLADGGLGCALWDGGVVLARWIYLNKAVFAGQTVLELGSGCGLAGIMAARYAKHCTMTDYMGRVIDNLQYNIDSNSTVDDSDEDEDTPDPRCIDGVLTKKDIRACASAGFLDWDLVGVEASSETETETEEGSTKEKKANCTKVMSKIAGEPKFFVQDWYKCRTCYGDSASDGCCAGCAAQCHKGHEVTFGGNSRFSCDCGDDDDCYFVQNQHENILVEKVDVILGAELTYNMLSIKSLVRVVDKFLKPDGVFYEVLSDDRDGVSEFVREIGEAGFEVHKVPVPAEFKGQYSTRAWSKQDEETYSFFTFRRQGSPHPLML